MKKIRIYTKTGDDGQTSLFGGKRLWKDSQRVVAYGTLDELNAALGVAASFLADEKSKNILETIQTDLFYIGAELANPQKIGKSANKVFALGKKKISGLEKAIDRYDSNLPALVNFILPGGSKSASLLHLSRSICRRAEREVINLSKKEEVNPNILMYLNRLSDLLFILARYANKLENKKENIWEKT